MNMKDKPAAGPQATGHATPWSPSGRVDLILEGIDLVYTSAPAPAAAPTVKPKREPRRHRTGRTAQFNARATPETVEAFYTIADQQGWLIAETCARPRGLAARAEGVTNRRASHDDRGPPEGAARQAIPHL
jgi:hypothetical protein